MYVSKPSFLLLVIFIVALFVSHLKAQTPPNDLPAGTVMIDDLGFVKFEMVYVPAGIFEMGVSRDSYIQLFDKGGIFEIPNTAWLDSIADRADQGGIFDTFTARSQGFWIDRYEVTIEQYESLMGYCIQIGDCLPINLEPEFRSSPQQPQINTTWYNALKVCNARDAHLPTEEEWEYAASGPDNYIFPWGNSLETSNFVLEVTYPVGSVPGNISWSGAYDMAGNAREWVEDRYQPYPFSNRDLTAWYALTSETYRVIRGGDWSSYYDHMTTYDRLPVHPDSQAAGFRCARYTNPEGK
jgi:formylglycine-generating enzyme required for sulfatase activity